MRMYLHTKVWQEVGARSAPVSVGRKRGAHVRARLQEIGGHRVQPSLGVGRCIAVQGGGCEPPQPVGLGGERLLVRLSAGGGAGGREAG